MHTVNSIFVFVSICIIFTCARATKMSSCSKGILPNVTYSINAYVCEASPCTCILGCLAAINFEFVSPRYLEAIKPKIHASCMGVELDYPINQDDACDGITNTQCPLVKNEKINYRYGLTIPNIFPEVTVTLKFSLIDKILNEEVVCFEFDINVKKDTCPQ